MFKNVLLFFSISLFFFSTSELKSLTKNQVLEIKQKVNIVSSIVTKSRIKKSKFNIEKYKKSKVVFNAIKKKRWNEANKLAKNNEVLIKIVDWHFLKQNNSSKFFSKTNNFIKENPDWPQKKLFRKKIELFIDNNLSNKEIIRFFEENPPLSTKGAVNYIDALRK